MPDVAATAPRLTTQRLTLRGPTAADLPAVFDIYADAEVKRYLSSPVWTDPQQAQAWLMHVEADRMQGRAVPLVIELTGTQSVIGTCAVFAIHADSRRAELGYALARRYWGQGYMREAVTALLAYAFDVLDLRRLEADIDPRNRASAALLHGLGFCLEGRLRERWEVAGDITDSDIYGLLGREWRRR